MKKVLLILSCCFILSCAKSNEADGDMKFKTVVVDSCEYIFYKENSSSSLFTHKGNCKFCALRLGINSAKKR